MRTGLRDRKAKLFEAVRRAVFAASAELARALREDGLAPADVTVLRALHGSRMRSMEIVKASGLASSVVGSSLRRLSRMGFVRREKDKSPYFVSKAAAESMERFAYCFAKALDGVLDTSLVGVSMLEASLAAAEEVVRERQEEGTQGTEERSRSAVRTRAAADGSRSARKRA